MSQSASLQAWPSTSFLARWLQYREAATPKRTARLDSCTICRLYVPAKENLAPSDACGWYLHVGTLSSNAGTNLRAFSGSLRVFKTFQNSKDTNCTAGSTLGEHKIKICMYDLPDVIVTAATAAVWEECIPPSQSSTPSGRKLAGLSRRLSESDQKAEYKPSFAALLFWCYRICVSDIYFKTKEKKSRWGEVERDVVFSLYGCDVPLQWILVKRNASLNLFQWAFHNARVLGLWKSHPSNLLEHQIFSTDMFCSLWELH